MQLGLEEAHFLLKSLFTNIKPLDDPCWPHLLHKDEPKYFSFNHKIMFFSDLISFIKENRFKGRRQSFQLDDEGLEQYIRWAFCGNHLFLVLSEKGILGVGVAYALPKAYNGYIENLLPSDNEVLKENEHKQELCVMDWIAQDSESRKNLINQFTTRFPNWENQTKWGIQFGKVKQLTNKYMNTLKGIN